jgi:hypothetical protein
MIFLFLFVKEINFDKRTRPLILFFDIFDVDAGENFFADVFH